MSGPVEDQGSSADQAAASLPDEHAVLRQAVQARAEPVVRAADAGDWPATELTELVNYLQLEVLRQIADEEWLLFRAARTGSDELAVLRLHQRELRLAVDLPTAAATEDPLIDLDQLPGPAGVDAVFDRLLRLRPEEQVRIASRTDLNPLWRRLSHADPGGCRTARLRKGPPRWEIEIVKPPPPEPLVAQPE